MKRRNHRAVFTILSAFILALVVVVPASADKPLIVRDIFELDFLFEDCGFAAYAHIIGKSDSTLFYDNDGVPRAGTTHSGGMIATMTYNGHTLTWHNVENFRWRLIEEGQWLQEFTGLTWGASVPGFGRASAGTGRVVTACHMEGDEAICDEVLHFSGLHVENLDVVCHYLEYGN